MPRRPPRPDSRASPPIAVAYLRRSTDRQEQSIPDQRRAVEAYASDHRLRLVRFYVDDAISGTTATRRPAFQEMVADAQKPNRPFEFVLVYDVKRFGRLDNDEAGYYRHILRTHGVDVRYVSENFNGDTTDDLLRPVKQWQARQESKDLAKVTIRGLLSRVEGGWWMGGTPPYGYDLEYVNAQSEFLFRLRYLQDGAREVIDAEGQVTRVLAKGEQISLSKRDRARLVPSSPERVEVIRRIFNMSALEQRGMRSIADVLNREGIPAPRGPGWAKIYSGQWTITTVRSILLNPQYMGDLTWNRRTDARFYRIQDGRAVERRELHGSRLEKNPEDDWIVVRGSHEALVPRALWHQCKSVRESRMTSAKQRGQNPRAPAAYRGPRAKFLLSGLITCGRCGGRYEGTRRSGGRPRKNGSKSAARYYVCSSYVRRGRSACSLGAIKAATLEEVVIEAVLGAFERFRGQEGRRLIRDELSRELSLADSTAPEQLSQARAVIESLDQRIAVLVDNLTDSNRKSVDRRLRILESQRVDAEHRVVELEMTQHSRLDEKPLADEVSAFTASLPSVLREGTQDQRIACIRRVVSSVSILRPRSKACVHLGNLLAAFPAARLPRLDPIQVALDLGRAVRAAEAP